MVTPGKSSGYSLSRGIPPSFFGKINAPFRKELVDVLLRQQTIHDLGHLGHLGQPTKWKAESGRSKVKKKRWDIGKQERQRYRGIPDFLPTFGV